LLRRPRSRIRATRGLLAMTSLKNVARISAAICGTIGTSNPDVAPLIRATVAAPKIVQKVRAAMYYPGIHPDPTCTGVYLLPK